MQLDLFLDNRRTILGNLADEHLRNLELDEAAGIYDRILGEWPDDSAIASARRALDVWRERLQRFQSSSGGIDGIHSLYGNLAEPVSSSLKSGIRSFIIDWLQSQPAPELIFIPPRFHLGCLLMEAGKIAEAETWFALALDSGIPEQGRFLAYLGDALFVKGETGDARECYRAAFLEDPSGIDMDHQRDRAVLEMVGEMEEEGLSGEEAIGWIPVWGWLTGVFSLGPPDADDPPAPREETRQPERPPAGDAPRRWFCLLRKAERPRTEKRDDAGLVRARREMRELNPLMFERYMEKLRG